MPMNDPTFNSYTAGVPPNLILDGIGGSLEEEESSLLPNCASASSGTDPTTGMDERIPEGGFAVLNNVAVDGAGTFGVSACLFDNEEELLWMGNSGGHVTSYFSSTLDKYTSFQVVPRASERPEVRGLLTSHLGLFSLSQQRLKCNKRQGIGVFEYTSGNLVDAQCMDFCPMSESQVVIGGFQESLVQLDIHKLLETRVTKITQNDATILRANHRCLYTGDTQGNVTLRDPSSLEAVHVLESHNGSLSDFHVCGMKLVTCGFSYRMGQLQCDRFLMLYDLRTLRAQRPVPLNLEPAFVRFLPTYSDNRLVVASQSGEFQVFEIGELTSYPFQVETGGSGVFCLDVSPSKQCTALGDGAGVLHLFSDRAQPLFNHNSTPTHFPDPIVPLAPMSFDDLTLPYSMIPLPMPQSGPLLSDWPPHLCRRVPRRPIPVDPDILKSMRVSQFVGYAPNPGNRRRNQVPYEDVKPAPIAASDSFSTQSTGESLTSKAEEGGFQVPKLYRKMTVKPGKFFGDDAGAAKFWRNYNQTGLSGLESMTPNAYSNAITLILYHIVSLRNSVMSHLCRKEFCLTCELSFLFKMMSQAAGKVPCSGNNYIRAFRAIPEAAAQGLVLSDKDDPGTLSGKWAEKIQNFNHFLLHQLHRELGETMNARPGPRVPGVSVCASIEELEEPLPPSSEKDDSAFVSKSPGSGTGRRTTVETLFATEVLVNEKCLRCGTSTKRNDYPMVLSLSYPALDGRKERVNFRDVVERSVCSEGEDQTWCPQCERREGVKEERRVGKLPEILSLHVNPTADNNHHFLTTQQILWPSQKSDEDLVVENVTKPCRYGAACNRPNCRFLHRSNNESEGEGKEKWESGIPPSSWFPPSLALRLEEDGRVSAKDTQDASPDMTVYELEGMVFVMREWDEQEHLVSCVKRRGALAEESGWVVFNDFVVSETREREAIQFSMDWKIPAILHYSRHGIHTRLDNKVVDPIDETVFWMDDCVSVRRRLSSSTFVPLEDTEIPRKGDIVAIDAEFVTLNQEDSADGTRPPVKPSQMSLARVSCIRGSGEMEGIPFLDDYISTQEEVADYLTKFSGIKPGDLDPCMTSKHLTTLKSSYLKLRYLVDNGVIFVGHGLSNDFRVINILVPPEQVRDTVHLFHLPHHRMMSLRFLAWYFLDMKIQSETHDSIEDARTALKLYKKYLLLSSRGPVEFGKTMTELYETASKMDWKVPGD